MYGNDTNIFEEDSQDLKFSSGSYDGVFTCVALEHILGPNLAFLEIDRILMGSI